MAASNSCGWIGNPTPRTVFSFRVYFFDVSFGPLGTDVRTFECFNLASCISFIKITQKKLKTNVTPRSIVLASNSPRRKALLQQLRLPFKVVPTFVNESRNVSENAKIWLSDYLKRKRDLLSLKTTG